MCVNASCTPPAASCLIGAGIDRSSFSLFPLLYFGHLDAAQRNPLAFAKTALTAARGCGKIALNGQTDGFREALNGEGALW